LTAPVPVGRPTGTGAVNQSPWAEDFDATQPIGQSAADFIVEQVNATPGEITIVPIGALTNIGRLLTTHPGTKSKIKRIVLMGGAAWVGYNNQAPPSPEWNIRCDPVAAGA